MQLSSLRRIGGAGMETGYYWVRFKGTNQNIIAFYTGEYWWIPGSESVRYTKELVIGPRVKGQDDEENQGL